jgi:predicted naringenin-chalcone synthase
MAWSVGDRGFDIALSGYVPKIIGANIRRPVHQALAAAQLGLEEIAAWAVHPGGRSIVEQVRQSLDLTSEQVAPALEVLRNFGNMSSATVLFVLQEILRRPAAGERDRLCAMAVGPGLTVELALLEREGSAPVPGAVPGMLAL